MSMPWPRWPLLLASLLAGPSLAAGGRLASVSPTNLLQLRAREPSRAAESLSQLKAQRGQLGLSERDEFRMSGVQTDSFGLTHTRFQQLHEGVPVWGAVAITHLDPSGRGLSVTKDSVRPNIHVGTRPVVDAASAAALALLEVRPLGLPTKQPATELVIYPEVKRVGVSGGKRRWQVNAEDVKEEVVRYRLAWHVHTVLDNAQDGIKRTDFLLDALTGEVIQRWNSLETAATVGTGHSQYHGEVPLDVFQNANGRYELRDTTRTYGEGLRTYDVNHANIINGEIPSPVLYEDEDNVWGDGQNYDPGAETLSANGQTAAVDAHFGLQATWDYFQKIHHRFGIDNAGTPTFSYVHVGNAMDNAFWDDECFCMNFGDGTFPSDPDGFKSLGSIDVTAHELSHGVNYKTADLIYSGESGGLNEANSDIFGTMTEFWLRNGRGDTIGDVGGNWTISEELSVVPLRFMYKPSLDGVSEDAWSPMLGSLDPHFNSGPMNRAFFFLSQGAKSTATANDYSSEYLPDGMTGIGNDKAAAIWYRALTTYLTPSSNYAAARTASLRSAAELHGSGSEEYRAVQNAFAAINVGYNASTYDDLTPPTVTTSVSGSAPLLRFSARALDNVGVTRVEFYVDNVLAHSSATQPFQFEVDTSVLDNGTHQVVAKAFDRAGNTGTSAPVSFTVANSYSQLLSNPGFEQGSVGWVEGPEHANINYPYPGGRTGQGFVWLNGYAKRSVDSVYQEVTLPADAQTAALTFYLKIFTSDASTTANDTLVVQVRDTEGTLLEQLATWSNLDATLGQEGTALGYAQRSFDLSVYAGRTVRLYFEGTENEDAFGTSFLLDDLALRVSPGADTEAPIVKASAEISDTGQQVQLFGHVSDDGFVGAVELIVDGTSLGTTPTSFTKLLSASTLGAGIHTLVVKATDAAGHAGTSAPVSFYLDPNREQLVVNADFELYDEAWTIDSPYTDSNGVFLDFFGAGYTHSGYFFFLFGADEGPNTSTLHQTVTIPANAVSATYAFWLWVESNAFHDGQAHHTLTAKVRDANSNELKTLETFSNLDTTPFYAEHRYDLSEFKGQTVQLFFESNLEEEVADPSSQYTYFSLEDITLDVSGTPDTLPPSLQVGVIGSSGTVQLYAAVSDNVSTEKLEFFVDGAPVTTIPNANGEYTRPFDVSALANGPHEFTAKATDRAGNVREAKASFEVHAVNDAAPPSVNAAVEGAFETTVFTASATDDTGVTVVEFYVDGAFQGSVQTAPYRLPFSTLPLSPGEHTLKVVAFDAYGHSASATATFTRAGPLLSSSRVLVPVDGTYNLSTLLTNGADPLLLWNVQEGRICGTVSWTGVYTAPAAPGLCHVLITHKQDARLSAKVDVRVYTADLNGDRVVDGEDMARIAQAWGTRVSSTTAADLDASGSVDDSDVTLFVSQFGR